MSVIASKWDSNAVVEQASGKRYEFETNRRNPQLTIENVGGIDHTDITFNPGVTILAGRNATNRTSLLQALMAALGSEHVSLKGDTDEGHVELEIGDSTYTRTLSRTDDAAGPTAISTRGEPYVEDAELADLFAFLLETNEARQAVARSDDLRELIMRPIDTDALQAEIDQLDQLEDRLPDLEGEWTDLDDHSGEGPGEGIASPAAEIDAIESELEERRNRVQGQVFQKDRALISMTFAERCTCCEAPHRITHFRSSR